MAQIPASNCGFCDNAVAVLYCAGCHQILCVECKQCVHDKVPFLKDHEVVNINKEGNRVFKPIPVCDIHNSTFRYYCSKCDCLTCEECMTSTHNEHRTIKIKNVSDDNRKSVNDIIDNLKKKVKINENKLKVIDREHFPKIDIYCESYISKVKKTAEELYSIIDRTNLIYKTTASDFREMEVIELNKKRSFFQRLKDESADRILKFKNIMQETNDIIFFTDLKNLKTDIEISNEESDQPLNGPNQIDEFDKTKFILAVIEDIDMQVMLRLKEKEIAFAKLSSEVCELRAEVDSKQRKIDELSKEQEENSRMQKTILKLEKELKAVRIENDTSLTTVDVPMPEGWTITDLQLKEIETELNMISPEIFSFRSKDAKTLTLKGNQYEQLQMAKTKCEFILGIKQQGRAGRRTRVISTDLTYRKEGNEQMGNTSFRQSVTPSRSLFSKSISGGFSSPSSPPQRVAIFRTSEGLLIHVYEGHILNLKVDCIVNAANETLSHGEGVADVISRAAGYGFQQESDDYIQRYGQLNVTESAGSLPYQCVIHAVGPRWYTYTDKRKCANDLEETVKNCFKVAEKRKMTSVAMPAFSSGIFGVPREVCCRESRKAVQDFSRKNGTKSCLKEIHFVDKDAGMISMIQKEFSQIYIVQLSLTQ